jgi:rRNA-processing protein FCF1
MKITDYAPVVAKYRRRGVILDSNLLLLLLVGRYVPQAIGDFKLLTNQGFTVTDFEQLRQLVSAFSKIIITPHIMTEVSNQCGQYKRRSRLDLMAGIAELISQCAEEFRSSKELVVRADFPAFGLTDTAISAVTPGSYLVLTKDFALASHLSKLGVDALNFTQFRDLTSAF